MKRRVRHKYAKVHDGDWVCPVRKGYRMKCCDCGLVHVIDFKLVRRKGGKSIFFRAFRKRRSK